MLAMYPAQIHVISPNIFLGKFDNTTFMTISMAMQNFGNKKFSNKGLQGIPPVLTHFS